VLADILKRHFREDAPQAAHVIAPDGRILVSLSGLCGKRLSSFVRDQLPDAKHRGPTIVNPLSVSERIEGIVSQKQRRMIWFEAAINDSAGRHIAYIGYGLDAERHFDRALQDTSTGFTSELFAFDRHGSVLKPGKNEADSPLVHEALAGHKDKKNEGVLLEPFAGRQAFPTVGAWRWLEEGNMAWARG
jgi:hypothetical protein